MSDLIKTRKATIGWQEQDVEIKVYSTLGGSWKYLSHPTRPNLIGTDLAYPHYAALAKHHWSDPGFATVDIPADVPEPPKYEITEPDPTIVIRACEACHVSADVDAMWCKVKGRGYQCGPFVTLTYVLIKKEKNQST